MKPLHRSTWRTESDCGVLVDVSEGRTTEWAPFREIVVTMDAGMTPAEARRLIVDLQHAVALVEEFDAPEREDVSTEDQPKPRVWNYGDAEPVDARTVRDVRGVVWTCRSSVAFWHTPGDPQSPWAYIVRKWAPVTEVLADSEQVTR